MIVSLLGIWGGPTPPAGTRRTDADAPGLVIRCASSRPGRRRSRAPATSGMTLLEIMVSMFLFAIMATAMLAAFLHTRKLAVSNLSQSFAQTTAQSIIEQIIRVPPSVLADTNQTAVEIRLPALTATNLTTMPAYSIPWAATATDFTEIGTAGKGLLTDAAYIASSNTIRPEDYMHMRVNLQRTVEATENRVRIALRYEWELPDRRRADGTPLYLSGEIRTMRSMALRF